MFTTPLALDVREAEKQMVVRWQQSPWWGQPGGNPASPTRKGMVIRRLRRDPGSQ